MVFSSQNIGRRAWALLLGGRASSLASRNPCRASGEPASTNFSAISSKLGGGAVTLPHSLAA